jgi:hypothetical protein
MKTAVIVKFQEKHFLFNPIHIPQPNLWCFYVIILPINNCENTAYQTIQGLSPQLHICACYRQSSQSQSLIFPAGQTRMLSLKKFYPGKQIWEQKKPIKASLHFFSIKCKKIGSNMTGITIVFRQVVSNFW